ncbi:MAG: SUMF1/EgtB/PvdO family nonheme iron enzyme [Xanthomonadales bacterium]|nr:SUMF1/EgtB/PvdO family nonheme iron enzyme [Xanthomonadales bacterium]
MRRRLMDATVGQEWTPEYAPLPNFNVEETLAEAERALTAGRLDGDEDSALSLYTAVLQNEPENADARAGIDRTVTALLERGEEAFAEARFNEATRIVGVVSPLRPDSPALASLRAKLDSDREVAGLLAEALRLERAGQLVEPAGENASEIYRQILSGDSNNAGARDGLARVERLLVERAASAAESGNFSDSERILADAGKVAPGSEAVQDASARVNELREERVQTLLEQGNAALEAGNLEEAQGLVAQLEGESANADGIDQLKTAIENARSYASLRPGQSLTDPLGAGGNGPELVVVPLGSFQMGSPDNEPDRKGNEGPRFAVRIQRGFALSRSETTVGQFRAFIEATGYTPSSSQNGSSTIYDERSGSMTARSGVTWESDHNGRPAAADSPVIHVSWVDAKAYSDWLSQQTGKRYRLPSEAEFEYVLRAGTQTRFPWGEGNPTRLVGNLTGDGDRSDTRRNWVNSFPDYQDGYWGPAPVRSYEANRFGIHDINGNVSEWVEDCWHDNYQRAPTDGSAWVNPGCNRRVIRGGSWASSPDQARSAFRLTASPTTTNARLGFRVAREL